MGAHPYDGIAAAVFPPGGRCPGLEVAGFIQKPFGLGALVELVLRLLPAQA
jgi:hypothetical protein